MGTDNTHAKFSPSSLKHLELCPGWGNDSSEESIFAADGTWCHAALEGKINGDETAFQELPGDLQSFVEEIYDYVIPRIAGAEKVVTEERVFHENPILKELAHGTPDIYAITGDTAQLIDAKFGRRPVEHASTNLQGYAYALALFDTYNEIQNITVHFVVPRVHNCTSNHTFTRSQDYDRMLARVVRVVERAQANRVEDYSASWSSCCYCRRKSTCPTLSVAIGGIYDLATDAISTVSVSEAVTKDDAKSLGFLNNVAKVTEDWAKQQQERIKMMAMSGSEVTGYELRFSKGRTTVRSVGQVIKAGVEIPIEKILEAATIPLAEIRKIYTSGTEASEKEDKEKELMNKLAVGGALKSGEDTAYLYKDNSNK